MTITYFPRLTDTKTHKHLPLKTILDGIKNPRPDGSVKHIIEQIRTTPDKAAREELKKTLPLVTFGGKFTERRASALVAYSNIICLDFDEVECIEDMKAELAANPYIMACWVSPNGCGLKALVKVSSNNHLAHSLALLKDFPNADANAIKDVVRACFLSYDPLLFYNPKAEVYTRFVESVHTDEEKFELLKKWLSNKGVAFIDGNRNSFLAKLFGAMNRFGIPKEFAWQEVERDYIKGSSFSNREGQAVLNSIYTNYSDQFNTASFDSTFSDAEVSEILSTEVEVKDIITVKDVMQDLSDAFTHGIKGGDTTYFPELDKCYRFMRGEITTLTGVAGAGKSSILAQLLLFRAAFDKQKSIFLSMESYPPVFFYREFARTLIGKPVEHDAPNKMTKKEYDMALEFINEYFYFLYPSKDDPSPEWTIGRFAEAVVKYGVDTCVIDPVNSMSYDFKSAAARDDRMIAANMTRYQRFALQNNVHFFVCAHPRGLGKKEDGTYKEPTADEISGGVTYWQRSDNVLCFHRPTLPVDFRDPTCTLRSLKIKKSQLNGIPGVSTFSYDRRAGRYTENGFNPLTNFKL